MTFKIFHGPGVIHFRDRDSLVESGQPNQEFYDKEEEAIARLLELNPSFFPAWDSDEPYMPGQRVMVSGGVYRCLQGTRVGDSSPPDQNAADWLLVYAPEPENLS